MGQYKSVMKVLMVISQFFPIVGGAEKQAQTPCEGIDGTGDSGRYLYRMVELENAP